MLSAAGKATTRFSPVPFASEGLEGRPAVPGRQTGNTPRAALARPCMAAIELPIPSLGSKKIILLAEDLLAAACRVRPAS